MPKHSICFAFIMDIFISIRLWSYDFGIKNKALILKILKKKKLKPTVSTCNQMELNGYDDQFDEVCVTNDYRLIIERKLIEPSLQYKFIQK